MDSRSINRLFSRKQWDQVLKEIEDTSPERIQACRIVIRYLSDTPFTLMHRAIECGAPNEVLLALNGKGLDWNVRDEGGGTPLHAAAMWGNLDAAQFLVSIPTVDATSTDNLGMLPIHWAANINRLDLVKVLSSLPNADVNAKAGNLGSTPLHFAVRHQNSLDMVRFLSGLPTVDVNAKNLGECTPLYGAVTSNNFDVVKLLLSYPNVDVNAKNINGMTPLHQAALLNARLDIMKLLLKNSTVEINAKDNRNRTALDYATEREYFENAEMVSYLQMVQLMILLSSPRILHPKGTSPLRILPRDVLMLLPSTLFDLK